MCDGMISSYCDGTCACPQPQPADPTPGLHTALAALVEDVPNMLSCGVADQDHEGCYVYNVIVRLRALLDENPADLPVATDSTTACDGSGTCVAPLHEHGCYADHDGAACDDPADHPAPGPSDRAGYGPCNHECNGCPTCDPGLTSDRAGLSPAERGEAYYREHGWSGCDGSSWERLPTATRDGWEHAARLANRLAVAERDRDEAQRQLDIVSAQAVQIRDEREFRIRERNRAEARADAAARERDALAAICEAKRPHDAAAAAVRAAEDWRARAEAAEQKVAAVEALHRPDGGIEGPGAMCVACTNDFGLPSEEPVPWPCPTIAALGDSAQVVQRIKDEAVVAALETAKAAVLGPSEDLRDVGTCQSIANDLDERARRVRDGGDRG